MSQTSQKQAAAHAALQFIEYGMIIGVGSGSTVNYFIDALKPMKGKIEGAVASSAATAERLSALHIPLLDLNTLNELPLYIDGADEIDPYKHMIKGGGAALTREKIIASVAKQFVCIVDASKAVDILGTFPVPVEVIPIARSYVARQIVKLGGHPIYRQGVITDNGNVILDVHHLTMTDPLEIEKQLNNITGVVTNGIFAARSADIVLVATDQGVIQK